MASAGLAQAQEAATADGGQRSRGTAASPGLEEIIVTAKKREDRLSDVPMSITALAGEQLRNLRVFEPSDLQQVVPGFSFTPTQFGTPVYTLRGVGFYDTTLSASPAVSVYVDEVVLPFPAMARGALFDLERVEVLKGPQGTLFGQNSTGGAINYVTAKPTEQFSAGADLSSGTYDLYGISGFVSGPLSDTLSARLALRTRQSGEWQENYTGPGELGDTDFSQGRLSFAWTPFDRWHVDLSLNAWKDESDTQAPQLIAIAPSAPATLFAEVASAPLAPADAQAANWNPSKHYDRDNRLLGATLRTDLDLWDATTLTSLTAYQNYERNALQNIDGMTAEAGSLAEQGEISSFFQELRLAGETGSLTWVLGGNYERDDTIDRFTILMSQASNSFILGFHFPGSASFSDQDIETIAAFGNVEWALLDTLTLEAGTRYTDTDRSFRGCSRDLGEGSLAAGFALLQSLFGVPAAERAATGQCVTLDPSFRAGAVVDRLTEDNVSWRAGINWRPWGDDALIYANISQGYKAGSFPTLSAAAASSLAPATQEKLLAYEAGFKLGLAARTVQLNGAMFYYDYTDKQLVGNIVDPIFGRLAALVNIPESRVKGAELQFLWNPMPGLVLNTAAAYTNTKILRGSGIDTFLNEVDFRGSSFPYTPKWQLIGDVQYTWDLSGSLSAFVGTNVSYRSHTKSGLAGDVPLLRIDEYTLVDLRAGVEGRDGRWRAWAWAQNVTDEYYWTNVLGTLDTIIRYAGMPATYGVSLSLRY